MADYKQYFQALSESEREFCRRVEAYIEQGMSRSDAQGAVEAEMIME